MTKVICRLKMVVNKMRSSDMYRYFCNAFGDVCCFFGITFCQVFNIFLKVIVSKTGMNCRNVRNPIESMLVTIGYNWYQRFHHHCSVK